MKVMRGLAAVVAAVVAAVPVLTGCGGGAEAEGRSEPVRIVVLGSSFPTAQAELSDPGKWWVQFADNAAAELGAETTYDLLSLGSVQDAVGAVSEPGPDADTIAAADIVLVTVGGNQALPDPETGIGCTTWFLEAKGPCLEEGVATYGDLYDQLYAGVKALRGDKPTVYAQTTNLNANIESPDDVPDGLLSLYTKSGQEEEAKAWAVAAYDRWAAMQTERATAAGFQVIDNYHAFNGPDGTAALIPAYMDPPSELNAGGHDLFASQLTEVDLTALTDK
jgi:hypothetical protein